MRPNDLYRMLKRDFQKIDWFELQKSFLMAGVIVLAVSMCSSMWLIGMGYHGFDMGHNLAKIEIRYNVTAVDHGINIVTGQPTMSSSTRMIQLGSLQMIRGVTGLFVTSILFGVFVTTLRYMRRR